MRKQRYRTKNKFKKFQIKTSIIAITPHVRHLLQEVVEEDSSKGSGGGGVGEEGVEDDLKSVVPLDALDEVLRGEEEGIGREREGSMSPTANSSQADNEGLTYVHKWKRHI